MIKRLLFTFFPFLLVTLISLGQNPSDTTKTESIDHQFRMVDKSATFPGGMNKFYEYINKNIEYPTEKKKKGDSAKIYVVFIVEKDGSIDPESVKIFSGNEGRERPGDKNYIACKECEIESVRLLKNSPKWIPAEMDEKPVKQRMVVPIFFSQL